MILQSYSTTRIAFGERLGICILRLTGSCSGKLEIRALRLSGRPKLVTLRSSSLCGSNPKKFWKAVKDLENKPFSSQLPMMWLLLTRNTWLSSLITISLSQDSYLTQPCLIAHPTFPYLPPLLMQLALVLLPLFPLPCYKISQSLRC